MARLDDKVAVITGGCSGIGLATVELFAAEGARIVIADIQDDRGHALTERLGEHTTYVHCDVLQETQIAAAMQSAVDRFGKLDIVFNNAGAGGRSRNHRGHDRRSLGPNAGAPAPLGRSRHPLRPCRT